MISMGIELVRWSHDPVRFFKDVFNLEPYPYQANVLRKLRDLTSRNPINRLMICSAGSTGKTRLIAGLGLYGTTIYPSIIGRGYRVIILGGSETQSRIVYEYIKDAIRDNKILKDMIEGDPLKSITKFKNKSVIKALAKSFTSIYGQHGDLVIIDEAVEAGDFVIRDSKRIIGESEYSRIILSTTPHDYTSLFVDMWTDNKEYPEYDPNKKQIGAWKRFSWSSIECPRVTNEMVQEAKRELPEWMFQVYWLGEPYPLIGTMIPLDKIKKATKGNPIFKYEEKYENPVMSCDWGFNPNPSAIIVAQRKNGVWYILKYKTFLRTHPDKVLDYLEQNAKDYNVSNIMVDGADIGEYLRLMDRGLPVTPIKFKNEKFIMQANLTNIFEKELIKIPEDFIPLTKELQKYTYEKKVGQDLIDALMMVTRAERQREMDLYYKITSFKKKQSLY